MTAVAVDIGFGLVLQATAVVLLFVRLRGQWVTHIGAWFILAAVFYHGGGELLALAFPGLDPYRILIPPRYVTEFVVLVSVAILLATLAYLWMLRHELSKSSTEEVAVARRSVGRLLNWKLMVVFAIPFLILTLRGSGVNLTSVSATGIGLAQGLSQQFLVPAVVLASFGIVNRFGRRWTLWVLLAQSILLAAAGQRFLIVEGAVPLIYLLYRYDLRLRLRELMAGVTMLLFSILVITAARASSGRAAFVAGPGTGSRFTSLATGATHLGALGTGQSIRRTLAYRFDGDVFGAMELQAIHSGERPLGLAPLRNDLLEVVPHVLDPGKLAHPSRLSEKLYAEEHLGILPLEQTFGTYTDILPTQLGVTTGYFGWPGVPVAGLLAGLIFGAIDRWLRRGLGPGYLLVSLSVLSGVVLYEQTPVIYLLVFRGIVLVLAAVLAIKGMRTLARAHQPHFVNPQISRSSI